MENTQTTTQQRLHAIVSGRVQGVSFRHYTTQKAQSLSLTGWVYNRSDGKVEVVAEGEPDALKRLESWLYRGSPAADVDSVDATFTAATGEFSDFRTVYKRG